MTSIDRGRCEECGANLVQDCPRCGAPNCCPQCCIIDYLRQNYERGRRRCEGALAQEVLPLGV